MKKIDYGRISALHKAGWTGKQIAEELGLTMEEYHESLFELLDIIDGKIKPLECRLKPLENKYRYVLKMLKS